MAPEQARGESHSADRRSDVYSLGVILFELLTGERPFRGNARMLVHQVVYTEAPSPRSLNATVPRDLETICLKCLQKSLERRCQTALEFAEELRRHLNGQPILSRPVSRAERLWRWCRRSPVVASLTAAVMSLLIFLAVAGPILYFHEADLRGQADKASDDLTDTVEDLKASEANAREATRLARDAKEDAESAGYAALLESERSKLFATAASKARDQAGAARDELRRRLYFSQMNLAQQSAAVGNRQRVLALLEKQVPLPGETDLRGFEWYFLWRQCHRFSFSQHGNHANGMCYTPDGKALAYCYPGMREHGDQQSHIALVDMTTRSVDRRFISEDESISDLAMSLDGKMIACATGERVKVYDLKTRHVQCVCEGHRSQIAGIAYSPASDVIASLGIGDGAVILWDATTGKQLSAITLEHQGRSIEFLTDGRTIAVGLQGMEIKLLDVQSGQESGTLSEGVRNGDWFISSLSVSSDGRLLAAAGSDKSVQLWDVEDRRLIKKYYDHTDEVRAVAFSADGNYLATGGMDHRVIVRNVSTSRIVREFLPKHNEVLSLAFAPDGTSLASSGHAFENIWDLRELPAEVVELETKGNRSRATLRFSPNGKRLAFANGIPQIWDPATGTRLHTFDHSGSIAVAYSPDGTTLATGGSRSIKIWDAESYSLIETLSGHDNTVLSLAFSPAGRTLASSGQDGVARLWDLESNECTHVLNTSHQYGKGANSGQVQDVAQQLMFTPDGRELITHITGEASLVWDVVSGELKRAFDGDGRGFQSSAALSPDGTLQVFERGHDVVLRSASTGAVAQRMSGHSHDIFCLAFSSDGKMVASGSRDLTVRVWDVASGDLGITLNGHADTVLAVAFSQDGRLLASADAEALRFWRAASDNDLLAAERTIESRIATHAVAFSPDGRTVAIGRRNGKIKLWDTSSSQMRLEILAHADQVHDLAFSADGRLIASSSRDSTVRVWDSRNGELLTTFRGHDKVAHHLCFTPDGKSIVSAGGGRTRNILLWDVSTGEELGHFEGHDLAVLSLAMSADGTTLVSGAFDKTVRLWDMATFEQRAVFTGHTAKVIAVDISPDGSALASVSTDQTVRLWDIPTGQETQRFTDRLRANFSFVSFSPDGATLCLPARNGPASIIDLKTKKEELLVKGTLANLDANFSLDGSHFAASSFANAAQIWDVRTASLISSIDDTQVSGKYLVSSPELRSAQELFIEKSSDDNWKYKPIPRYTTDYALDFRDGFIFSPALLYSGAHPITLEAWIKPLDLVGNRDVIGNPEDGGIFLALNSSVGGFGLHDGSGYKFAKSNMPIEKGDRLVIDSILPASLMDPISSCFWMACSRMIRLKCRALQRRQQCR